MLDRLQRIPSIHFKTAASFLHFYVSIPLSHTLHPPVPLSIYSPSSSFPPSFVRFLFPFLFLFLPSLTPSKLSCSFFLGSYLLYPFPFVVLLFKHFFLAHHAKSPLIMCHHLSFTHLVYSPFR